MTYDDYHTTPKPGTHLSMSLQLPHPRSYMGGLIRYLPASLVGEDYTVSIGRYRKGLRLSQPLSSSGYNPKQGRGLARSIDYMIFVHGQKTGCCRRIYTCMTVDEYGSRMWETRMDDEVHCGGVWGCGGWRVKTIRVGVLKAECCGLFDELVHTVKPGPGWKFMCAVIGYACHRSVGWFVEPRRNRKSREKERKRQKAREKLGIFPTTDAHYTRKNCGLAPGWKYTW